MTRVSPLHTKGFLTLSLLLFAESVTFTNAVSFWSSLKKQQGQQRGRYNHKTAGSTSARGTYTACLFAEALEDSCATNLGGGARQASNARSILLAKAAQQQQQQQQQQQETHDENFDYDSCCHDCSHCMNTLQAKSCLENMPPRGGHSHQSAATETLASAAAAAVATDTTPYGLPLHAWKVIFQTLLTAMNVLCWLLPLKSKKISQNKYALSIANAFSGGVFLSLAFGHLIPECVHGFHGNNNWPEETPYLLVLAGYLLIFFVEKVAFDAHEILHEMQDPEHHHHGHRHASSTPAAATTTTTKSPNGQEDDKTPAKAGSRSAVILLGALGVHSVLEMMALGLADTFADAALLTVSISLHQPAESIALLVAFLKSGMSDGQIIKYLSIFSCMGPIGVGLGMAVNEFAAPIVDSIMLAIVAGTFVYVGATEVIPEEWEDPTHKWPKFAALMTGIVSILVITQYTAALGGHVH